MKSLALSVVMAVFTLPFGIDAGCCGAGLKVEAVGHAERVIYHSPETPGYTSWVGLWQLPNGRIRCDFHQVTGSKERPVSTTPVLESRDGGAHWTRVNRNSHSTAAVSSGEGIYQMGRDSCRGMAVLGNRTFVRPVWAPVAVAENDCGFTERSTDGGKTWDEKIFCLPAKEYKIWPTLIRQLRDDRLVLFAGCWRRGDLQNGGGPSQNMTKMMFVSSDQGRTWSQPIVVMPVKQGVCEESDFCELPDGNLFWVHRVEHDGISDRWQSIVRKAGNTFAPDTCKPAPFPHSGFPNVLYTQEGLVLHLATDGISWTSDLGEHWTRLDMPGTAYYPKSLQLHDGTIVCIGHVGSDDKYGAVDQSIKQQTFRLRVARGQ